MTTFFNPRDARTGTEREILKFLEGHNIAAIATSSPSGAPHVSSVFYACDDSFNIYLMMKKSSVKYGNILSWPKVALAIGDSSAALRMIHLHAEGEVITDPHHFIAYYFENVENPLKQLFEMRQGENVYVKLNITWLRWLDLDIAGNSESREFQHIFPALEKIKVADKKKTRVPA